ncbi:ATP-binding protein [Spirillospora sp. NPDC047279]|uniref:ATP-binding protein n=1 Tax=Spirillospora sp. NPDC047279 TaxID=3155478 RepID=UPI003407BA44
MAEIRKHYSSERVRPAFDVVPIARASLRRVFDSWGLNELSDDAENVLSELLTNAITFVLGQGEAAAWVSYSFMIRDGRVEVRVWDPYPDALPEPREPDFVSQSGRGLFIVDALADDWSVQRYDTGKTVWASWPVFPKAPRTPAGAPADSQPPGELPIPAVGAGPPP